MINSINQFTLTYGHSDYHRTSDTKPWFTIITSAPWKIYWMPVQVLNWPYACHNWKFSACVAHEQFKKIWSSIITGRVSSQLFWTYCDYVNPYLDLKRVSWQPELKFVGNQTASACNHVAPDQDWPQLESTLRHPDLGLLCHYQIHQTLKRGADFWSPSPFEPSSALSFPQNKRIASWSREPFCTNDRKYDSEYLGVQFTTRQRERHKPLWTLLKACQATYMLKWLGFRHQFEAETIFCLQRKHLEACKRGQSKIVL